MGTTCLLDTNTVIYFLDEKLPQNAMDFVENCLNETGSFLSIISKIELLGWQAPQPNALVHIQQFINDSEVLTLSDGVANKAIELRQGQKIKLPDAVIAATALVGDFTLVSRNDDDFRKIPGLKYINPFTDI